MRAKHSHDAIYFYVIVIEYNKVTVMKFYINIEPKLSLSILIKSEF